MCSPRRTARGGRERRWTICPWYPRSRCTSARKASMSNEARRGTVTSVYRTLSPLAGRDGGGYGGDDDGKSRRLSVPELCGSGGTWQTRRPQKPVGETPGGFESPLPHHQLLIRFIEANGAISQSHGCRGPAGSGDAHAAPSFYNHSFNL